MSYLARMSIVLDHDQENDLPLMVFQSENWAEKV